MSDSVRPHRWQPTRLPRPWDSPGKNTGVSCHFLLWRGRGYKGTLCTFYSILLWTKNCSKKNLFKKFSTVHGSVMSDSLWPHGLQHARLPCPPPNPRTCSNSCPSSWWCHPTISSSVVPFSSCLQSCTVSGSCPMSQFSASSGQSILIIKKNC